ncbi:MAG TPA: hypothetical protein DCR02_06825 [Sphaerochaeta sp.]|nr:hypothetical protein [Sphaerochaeta sp.]
MAEASKGPVVDCRQVGSRIKELGRSHNFCQQAFSELLNISQGHLSRVEKGSVISAALCELIAEKFNTSSNKKIKKLLEDCNYEYSFIVDEIRDAAGQGSGRSGDFLPRRGGESLRLRENRHHRQCTASSVVCRPFGYNGIGFWCIWQCYQQKDSRGVSLQDLPPPP